MENEDIKFPISWQALEYDYIPKSSNWFWVVGIFTFAFLVIAIVMKNALFSIFSLLAGFSIALYGAKKPALASFSITTAGLQINKTFYLYKEIDSFWIHYDPPRKKELSIQSKKKLMPFIKIPLGDADPNIIRKALMIFLKEEEHSESIIESVGDYFGF